MGALVSYSSICILQSSYEAYRYDACVFANAFQSQDRFVAYLNIPVFEEGYKIALPNRGDYKEKIFNVIML